jgi:hypothetical protein
MSSINNEKQTSAKGLPKSREASPAARRQLPGHAPDDRQSLAETLNGVEALIEDTSQPGTGQLAEQQQSIALMTGARDAALREIARSLTANVTYPA